MSEKIIIKIKNLCRLGDNEKAVTDCKSALVYNANYGKAYGRLGIAYSNLCKYDEAIQAYTKAIELDPENQDYKNNVDAARTANKQWTNTRGASRMAHLNQTINALMANPVIRNVINNDMEQVMGQDNMVMNVISQMLSARGGIGGDAGAAAGPEGPHLDPQLGGDQFIDVRGERGQPVRQQARPRDQEPGQRGRARHVRACP